MQPKILLVDDREDNLLSMEAILAADGYEFFKARSGRDALKILLNETDFAIILMDVKMPVLNGFETANLIHEREKLRSIPIIFITANSYGDENVFKGYQSGGIDYILKPINPEILRAKVSVFVHLYEKNQLLMEQEQKLRTVNQLLGTELTSWRASEEKAKKYNDELTEKLAQLEAVQRDARLCTLVHAHKLLDPLREIVALSEKLAARRDGTPQETTALAGRLKQASEHAQQAFLDILALSKIPVGQAAIVDSDLNELVKETIDGLEDTIKATNASVVADPLPAVPVVPELARALFQNLLLHALTAGKKDTAPVVRIRSEVDTLVNGSNTNANGGPYCQVSIACNGLEQAGDAFELFKRSADPDSLPEDGIGLALCKRIMEIHNGFITARGTTQGGTVFTLSWPVHQPALTANVSGVDHLS